jgi:RimJ/RimL family protein N-acetyltransferase|tara:strand:+ start:340 stop:945 length:606 start_codon:yes stop_codon:yes gene_type:complete
MSKKTYLLKSKETVTVRDLSQDDVFLSHEFFQSIPESKRKYFRSDVMNINHLKERCLEAENGKVIRRIALMSGAILADASLAIDSDTWKSGTAYLRLVIDPDHIGKGVQFALAKDMYDAAHDKHLEKIVAKFMRPQKDLMEIYQKLGFRIEGVLPDYVHDQEGKEQDMVIMIASLEDLRRAQQFIGDWLDNGHGAVGAGEM